MKEQAEAAVKTERNTRQKELVRHVFENMHTHPTAQQVYEEIAKTDPSIGRATVYRILNSLSESGLALKIQVFDGADHFDETLSPHAHAKCRICKSVCDITVEGDLPKAASEDGFEIEGGTVLYYGTCRKCRENLNQMSKIKIK